MDCSGGKMKKIRKRQIKKAKAKRLAKLDEFDLSELIDIPEGLYLLRRKRKLIHENSHYGL